MPRAAALKKMDRPQTGPCLSGVPSLCPGTARTPPDLQRERAEPGQGCGNMAGLPEEVGWRSNGEAVGRRNWGSMSRKGAWRRLQWAARSGCEGHGHEPGIRKGPPSLHPASISPSVRRDHWDPPVLLRHLSPGLPHCVHQENGKNPVKEVGLLTSVPEGPEPDLLPFPTPAPLGNCIPRPSPRASPARAGWDSLPSLDQTTPGEAGGKDGHSVAVRTPPSSQAKPQLLGSRGAAWSWRS